jgi:hypothetical protein
LEPRGDLPVPLLFFLLASTQARGVHIFANTRDDVFAVHDDVELILGVTIDVGHK